MKVARTHNMVFAKAGLDKLSSAYTATNHWSWADRSLIGFTFSSNFRFFMWFSMWADTASNIPPSQIPGRWRQSGNQS